MTAPKVSRIPSLLEVSPPYKLTSLHTLPPFTGSRAVSRIAKKEQAYKIVQLRDKYIKRSDSAEVTSFDRILLANSYSDLGLALCNGEEYEAAKRMCLRSLELKSEASTEGGLPSIEYAATKFPLTYCKVSQGKIDEAISLCQEATDGVAAEEGMSGVSTARFRFHLASYL